jgi:hypothetical protein
MTTPYLWVAGFDIRKRVVGCPSKFKGEAIRALELKSMFSQERIMDGEPFTVSFSQDNSGVLYAIRSLVTNSVMVEPHEVPCIVKEEGKLCVRVIGKSS